MTATTFRMRSSACDTRAWRCVQCVLCWSAFPLVPALRSTDSAAFCSAADRSAVESSALFAGFTAVESGEVGLAPSLRPLAQTARAVFPQAAFLCGRYYGVEDGLSSSADRRLQGVLDAGAGSFAKRTCPHFRHVLARSSSFGSVTQYGAFPLRSAFWVRPASSFQDDDPRPFALISFKSTSPRSDSWHRIGRNFAHAYIRAYRRMASGRALRFPLLALSSASVALFQPYLSVGRYQASLSH
jgi:hypothetical protein